MSAECYWQKPRTKRDFLTSEEIAVMRKAFDEGRPTIDIAEELNCSIRIAAKYYARFREAPMKRGRPKRPPVAQPASRPSRFYKSNFEL